MTRLRRYTSVCSPALSQGRCIWTSSQTCLQKLLFGASSNLRLVGDCLGFLKSVFKDETVRDHLAEKGCNWTFNVEKATWWGGAFKRLVQSTKRCLKMVGQASLTHDELLTTVTEIESIINSRPLSYISAEDTEEPLTPSHLLIGHRVLNLPDYLGYVCDPGDEDFDLDSTQLTKRMKHLSNTINHFWKRWRNEYLAELRESHKHLLGKACGAPNVAVGDMVIVHDEGLPRSFWKLGRIQELIVGRRTDKRCNCERCWQGP